MGATLLGPEANVLPEVHDANFTLPKNPGPLRSTSGQKGIAAKGSAGSQSLRSYKAKPVYQAPALTLAQKQADIDISGPAFDFVRSIRVFDVRHAWQHEASREKFCNRFATVLVGTYGTQGDFTWRASRPEDLPKAHVGLEHWGEDCPRQYNRSVFVDWRDQARNYGFEQVDY